MWGSERKEMKGMRILGAKCFGVIMKPIPLFIGL
jgi:hypothetical protein